MFPLLDATCADTGMSAKTLSPEPPFRLVACVARTITFSPLADRNLWETTSLHDGPDHGQTRSLCGQGVQIGMLSHSTQQALNGSGGVHRAMHHLRERIQRLIFSKVLVF